MTGDILLFIAEQYNGTDDSAFTVKITRLKKNLLYDYYTILMRQIMSHHRSQIS